MASLILALRSIKVTAIIMLLKVTGCSVLYLL